MKKLFAAALAIAMIFNHFTVKADSGNASIHQPRGSARHTASGQVWSDDQLVAAHKHYPLGSYVCVVDPVTHKSVNVEIIDRGPFVSNRVIDISKLAAERLGMIKKGILKVQVYKL